MYLLVNIMHDIIVQCHWNFIEVGKFLLIMFEIDILRNYSQKDLGVLRGNFGGFACPIDTQTPCWLRLIIRMHKYATNTLIQIIILFVYHQ